jgi:hypothetical protein
MIKEILEFSQIDPDVLAARRAVQKLVKAIRLNMDPLMRNVIEADGQDILDFEKWVKNRSEAKKAVQALHNFRTPEISRN